MRVDADVTRDHLWRGRLAFFQPGRRAGYRFTLDSVLLAHFARGGGHVLDLGCGCGVVGILMLALARAQRLTAVEVQPALAALARQNAAANGLAHCTDVILGDLRKVALPQVDCIVFNPPYYPTAQFRPCSNPGRDQARREQNGTLWHFVAAAMASLGPPVPGPLGPAPEMVAIVPTRRLAELGGYVVRAGGQLWRQRLVLARPGAEPGHVLVAAGRRMRASAPLGDADAFKLLREEPPLVVRAGAGLDFSPEVQAWVEGPP